MPWRLPPPRWTERDTIVIGAFVPGRSWLHALPFGPKLGALVVVSIALNAASDIRVLGLAACLVIAIYASAGQRMLRRLGDLAGLWPMLLVIGVLQGVFDGWSVAVATLLRIVTLVGLASLVTYTTPTGAMLDSLAPVFTPLRRVGINPRLPALAIALVIRLVPMLLELWTARQEAWQARTGRKASIRLIPSFLAEALALADHMAEALDARGFSPSIPRHRP
jgi:biotin transport system permease protein